MLEMENRVTIQLHLFGASFAFSMLDKQCVDIDLIISKVLENSRKKHLVSFKN